MKKGFPSNESLKNLTDRLKRKVKPINEPNQIQNDFNEYNHKINDSGSQKRSKLFIALAFLFGTFIGINSGLFGAASGLIFTIALVLIYRYDLKKGVGTALILSMIICSTTFIIYQILGIWIKSKFYFNLEISLLLGIASTITAIITSNYVQKLSTKIMGRTIGFIIAILGICSLIIYFAPKVVI